MNEPWPVILFYKYVPIAEPERFAAEQRALSVSLGLKGRILIASEGINGTVAGQTQAAAARIRASVSQVSRSARRSSLSERTQASSACRLAREAVDEMNARTPQRPRFVAGSIGPTNRQLTARHSNNPIGVRI